MPQHPIDPRRIRVLPLEQRVSYIDITREAIDPSSAPPDPGPLAGPIDRLAHAILQARQRKAAVMLAYGAHLVKNGLALVMKALIEEGWVTHVATQGAGIIHDLEFALLGRSSESVKDNAPIGRFGTWEQTGRFINLAAVVGCVQGLGLGESVGRFMSQGGCTLPTLDELRSRIAAEPDHPLTAARADLLRMMLDHQLPSAPARIAFDNRFGRYSITQSAFEAGVPLTVHPGIGYDIFACHPMFHAGAIGRGAGVDFHLFCRSVENLTGGVYLSVGSAVMSPQVFEKSFSIANNLRQQQGLPFLRDHHIAIIDLQDNAGWDWAASGEPPKDHPAYYLRWCKTFWRMTDGIGRLDYLQGDNRLVLHNLLARLCTSAR